jgi:hypothetical protein
MDLRTFIADPARRAELARRCDTSGDWLYQISIAWRGRKASIDLARVIERESAVIGPEPVAKETLRPDVWPPEERVGLDAEQDGQQAVVHSAEGSESCSNGHGSIVAESCVASNAA